MCDSPNDLHKEGTTADFLDGPEGDGGGEHIDESEDEGDEERVGDSAGGLEERGGVVKDKVDTGPLLHHLERSAENGATEVAACLPKRTREAVEPAGPVASDGNHLAFVFGVGDNLGELGGDVYRVLGLTAKPGEDATSGIGVAFLDKVTGGLGKEVKAGAEDETPSKLDADRDTVRSRI